MVKRILMIAFHYPPMRGSSGIQRTLKFSQYLPDFDWQPIILTANCKAYASTSSDQISEIPESISVHRALAFDTSRHLSLKRRYPRVLALPDRWVSWWLAAVPLGLYLIRKYQPSVIWSTYPIATAHLIGLSLSRISGLPWLADLRDPMTDVDYPPEPITRRAYQWIEVKTITRCTRAILTTQGAIRNYQERFPQMPASRFHLIENGYDEENFAAAQIAAAKSEKRKGQIILVHSGVIYPSERDPVQLFAALSELSQQGVISHNRLRLILRATGHDKYVQKLIDQYAINDIVSLAPPVSYHEALVEMLTADGLLILQATNCNNQIPAKLYEYLRSRRPILALTDQHGDTAATLRKSGINTIARLDSKDDIMQELLRFITLIDKDKAPTASKESILASSRISRTRELADLLGTIAS